MTQIHGMSRCWPPPSSSPGSLGRKRRRLLQGRHPTVKIALSNSLRTTKSCMAWLQASKLRCQDKHMLPFVLPAFRKPRPAGTTQVPGKYGWPAICCFVPGNQFLCSMAEMRASITHNSHRNALNQQRVRRTALQPCAVLERSAADSSDALSTNSIKKARVGACAARYYQRLPAVSGAAGPERATERRAFVTRANYLAFGGSSTAYATRASPHCGHALTCKRQHSRRIHKWYALSLSHSGGSNASRTLIRQSRCPDGRGSQLKTRCTARRLSWSARGGSSATRAMSILLASELDMLLTD